jgi:tetratricopeptide (TPR) repeat protein
MNNLAECYAVLGRYAEALKLFQETLALRQAKLGPKHPETLWSMNDLAWLLATVPDAKLRNPAQAVELAAMAASADAKYRGTYGAARYQAGDLKGSIADLEHAISAHKVDDADNARYGFFLAMAHWQLGAKDKAHDWFSKSVAWMDKSRQDKAELKRFRAEAEKLLELKK